MSWSVSDRFPSWGETGASPGAGFFYEGGDQVNEKHLDYLWNSLKGLEDDVQAALDDIDTDADGEVDAADIARSVDSNHIGGGLTGGGGSNISHANTSSQSNVTTGGATVIDDIGTDGYGHVDNINTENRALDDWATPTSTVQLDREGIQSVDPWLEIDGSGSGLLLNYKNQGEETRVYGSFQARGTADFQGDVTGIAHSDIESVGSNDHHSRYSDSEARSAVDGANIDISGDADTVDGYDIQKNGSGGSGIINFKT